MKYNTRTFIQIVTVIVIAIAIAIAIAIVVVIVMVIVIVLVTAQVIVMRSLSGAPEPGGPAGHPGGERAHCYCYRCL